MQSFYYSTRLQHSSDLPDKLLSYYTTENYYGWPSRLNFILTTNSVTTLITNAVFWILKTLCPKTIDRLRHMFVGKNGSEQLPTETISTTNVKPDETTSITINAELEE